MANPPSQGGQTNSGPGVAAYMRVVANGVAKSGRAKATLIVTPRSPTDGADTGLNLPTWPGDIVAHLATLDKPGDDGKKNKFPVFVSLTDPTDPNAPPPARAANPNFVALADAKDGLDAVNGHWRQAIEGSCAADPWKTLLADVDRSRNGQKSSVFLERTYSGAVDKATLLDNGALVADPHDPNKQTVVKGVVPNPQSRYAVDAEAARAQRVTKKLAIGPYLPGDQEVCQDTAVPNPDRAVFAKDRTAVLLQRLTDSVTATNPYRQQSHQDFTDVQGALGGSGAAPAPAPAAPPAPAVARLPIAPAAQVLGKEAIGAPDGSASRAAHVYGSWTQWSPQHRDAFRVAAAASTRAAPRATAKAPPDPAARLYSIYYSLQGDPILSRLFGFAFDIEFDFPSEIQSGGDIWLAAGDASNPIWTKARYAVPGGTSKDKIKRFWPAPRFEASNTSFALSREQIHGVFDLGQGYDQTNPKPRYDLTSLGVRGAVSQSLDVNGIDAIDKGERHQTTGWTLLDSGRASQIARDLAIADHQRAASTVVLHAEELTIGRRLDVQAVGPKHKNAQWRSLMNRFVEFTNLPPAAKKRLDAIVADRVRKGKDGKTQILDEAAFQLVARSLPIVGDDAPAMQSNVEAVVEEAFQSWDGTPLAALACKPDANSSGSAVLPVKRAYDLPDSQFPELRPPPLRYGVGYVFSIRSEFAGGGSPSVDEAARWHDAQNGKMTLPPSDDKGLKPRRFLRHEALAAPILMLPHHLLSGTNGAMGFEPPARAVVRTATAPDKRFPGETNASAPGPDYIEPGQRAQPESTMRVFVAPMASLDFCARHGVFDNPNTAQQRLGGGLPNVEFYTDRKALGFPVAIVKRNTGFNADRLIYQRGSGAPDAKPNAGEDLGGSIFHPTARTKREGGLAYLPDPAAETMSFRLRVTGSDKYLEKDVLVELYPNGVDADYPNALPVVITVTKDDKRRAKPATAVTDVLNPKGIVRIYENGNLGPDSGSAGVRARHLSIVLSAGEQFDLEATCLPSQAKLAEWFSLPEAMGVQQLLAAGSPAAANALCVSCGEKLVERMTQIVGAAKPAARTGLGGYAPPDESGLGAVSKELLDCIRTKWQLSEVAGTTTLRVEHAVSAPQNVRLDPAGRVEVKPVSLANIAIVRPDSSTPPDTPPPAASAPGSTTLLLTGELLVDLEQVDAVDIVAEVVNPGGKPFDDPARGRSVLAKRAGRWPTILAGEGKRKYSRKRAVLGFDVDSAGKTSLLPETVTLLRIQNLPDPRAAINQDKGPKVFLDSPGGRLTRIDLGVLHWAARNASSVDIPIASDGSPEKPAMRTIGVSRPHEISDTRARCLKIYAVAVSRFARSFETAPLFSAEGQEHVLHRRQPLRDRDQRMTGDAVEPTWSKATARPAPAAAKTPPPFFAIERCAKKHRGVVMQHLVRKCGVRLRFERGMFSSGEGERIGIVLWPPDIVNIANGNSSNFEHNTIDFAGRTMTLNDFADADLGDGGQYISRWGGDPIRSDPTPQMGWFMPPTAFDCLNPAESGEQPTYGRPDPTCIELLKDGEPQAHKPMYCASVSMPISTKPTDSADGTSDGDTTPTFMQVALLTFEPYFDIDAEEWFVDVGMDAARPSDPFIRLGLVRYQPNAISDDLEVSTPVRVWTQLPPRRTLNVRQRPGKNESMVIEAVVRGQASAGIKPLPNDPQVQPVLNAGRAVWDRLQRPKMILKVVHETEREDVGKRQTNVFPNDTIDFRNGDIKNSQMVWWVSVTVPKARLDDLGPGRYVAVVEEIEERLPATYPNEPIKITDLLNADVVLQSGPRFIARVPFYEQPH